MTQDSELELGDIDDLPVDEKPAPATARSRGRGGGGAGSGGGGARGKGKKKATGGPAPGRRDLMVVSLALVVVMIAGGGFLYRELQLVRADMDEELARSTEQLSRLSAELEDTDETLLESWEKVDERLDFQMDEIRKLWAVSNERNRGWIRENQEAISKLQDERGELADTVDSVGARVDSLSDELAGVREAVENARLAQNRMETRVELVRESITEVETEVERRLDDLGPRLEALARLEEESDGVGARLNEIEEAIEAFDSYRRQLNTRLDRLEQRQ